jgi:hypothetical protein
LPAIAAREPYSDGLATEDECRAALAVCLARGWLQVIDEPALARIMDDLRVGRFMGPIYGLPPVGGVDFTTAGAAVWQSLLARHASTRQPAVFTDVVHIKTTWYFRTKTAALVQIDEAKEWDGSITIVGPSAIGPWRAQWWRWFPFGYRVDVEERRQWQVCSSGGNGCFMPDFPLHENAPERLQHVLDCHNVSFTEWLLLAAMDRDWCKSASHLPRWVADSASKQFDVTASEDECRAGLEACLRYGWLRIVDQDAVAEVASLLRGQPAIMPVPWDVRVRDEIDFTPGGAALYRMIAAEWLGPGWEDSLRVWRESYRKEHHYCETEEGLRRILQECAARGEVVRASKVVPIGPWCVYWWERFHSGCRLELQIGDP